MKERLLAWLPLKFWTSFGNAWKEFLGVRRDQSASNESCLHLVAIAGWPIVLKTSESIWLYPVFAVIRYVSIHLETSAPEELLPNPSGSGTQIDTSATIDQVLRKRKRRPIDRAAP